MYNYVAERQIPIVFSWSACIKKCHHKLRYQLLDYIDIIQCLVNICLQIVIQAWSWNRLFKAVPDLFDHLGQYVLHSKHAHSPLSKPIFDAYDRKHNASYYQVQKMVFWDWTNRRRARLIVLWTKTRVLITKREWTTLISFWHSVILKLIYSCSSNEFNNQ